MSEITWTREHVNRLIELGRSGISWSDVGRNMPACSETARRKWNIAASAEDRRQRTLCRMAIEELAKLVEAVEKAPVADRHRMPAGIWFPDDPRAVRPDYGTARRPETWVPYISGSAWAV